MLDYAIGAAYNHLASTGPLPCQSYTLSRPRQAVIVYLSFYCRTGGVDWVKLADNFDGAEIRAGQGYFGVDGLFDEHVVMADAHGVPYKTSWQLDPGESALDQIDTYCNLPGVRGHRVSLAVEDTSHGIMTATGTRAALEHCQRLTGEKPELYIGVPTLNAWDWPDWLQDYAIQIARYPWQIGTESQYELIDEFVRERAWELPAGVPSSHAHLVQFWQFSERLDAQRYFANAQTADPNHRRGLLSGTASVSTIMDVDETITWLGGESPEPEPLPTPEPDVVLYWAELQTRWVNIRREPAYPAISADDMGDLVTTNGHSPIVPVFEERIDHGNTWARIGRNLWVAKKYRGTVYLLPVEE